MQFYFYSSLYYVTNILSQVTDQMYKFLVQKTTVNKNYSRSLLFGIQLIAYKYIIIIVVMGIDQHHL